MMKKKLCLLFSFILLNTFSQSYKIDEIPEELTKGANAVVREKKVNLLIKSVNQLEFRYKSVISILNKAADNLSYVFIPYDRQTKISEIKFKVIDKDGKVIKTFSKNDLEDVVRSQDSYMYVDDRALVSKISQAVYPYTIEYTYSVRTSDTAFLPTLQPFICPDVSVENWSLEIINESDLILKKNIKQSIIGEPRIEEKGNTILAYFQNLSAIKKEKYAPDFTTLVSKVDFALDKACLKGKCGDFSSWQNLANWYHGLLDEVSVVTPEIQKEVDGLNLTGSTKEKVKKIYQYMQSKTRYVFVGIGIGGWQPMYVDDVRKKAYGDCKALTNYTRILLQAAGIKSYYAVIHMDNSPILFDENFPKIDGNHIVLYVPTEEGDIWLENTNQNIAFNHLSYPTRNRNIFLVDKENAKIIKTPIYNADDSCKKIKINASVKPDNGLDAKSHISYNGGWYDFYLDLVSKTKRESEEILTNNYYYLKFSKLNFNQLQNDRDKAELSYDLDFSVDNYAKSIGEEIYFNALTFVNSDFYLEENEDRKFPLEISFGYTDDYEIEYKLPQGYKLVEFILPIKIETEYGSYQLAITSITESKVLVNRKFVLNRSQIPVEKINDYINFRKQVRKADSTKLLIKKI